MNFLKKIINKISVTKPNYSKLVRINISNIKDFPKIEQLLIAGKVKFDSSGRLRYLHGAPVGDMVLKNVSANNIPVYIESAEEWFDPDSQHAKNFNWD